MSSFRHIESALRQATEYFACELASPGCPLPRWSEFEWTMAKATAVLHGVTPMLATRLPAAAPSDWHPFATAQFTHTLHRHRRIEALLTRIRLEAEQKRIAAQVLKGSALHQLGLYSAGQRPMADVDLLVEEHTVDVLADVLQGLGYGQTAAIWKHRVFKPFGKPADAAVHTEGAFGEHSDAMIKVEVHTSIAELLPVAKIDATPFILQAELRPGLHGYRSIAALLLHLLLHASGNMVGRGLRLIHLHDIALVAARMGEVDWTELLSVHGDLHGLWWAVPPLELAARYYPRTIPVDVLTTLRPVCPRALRAASRRQTLSDVSFTYLRSELFPGMQWAGSLSEKFQYVRDRVLPGAEQQSVHALVQSERWSDSGASSQPSRWRRGLKTLLSRPARVAPMYIVRAALQDRAARRS